jgi:hypothetical protein
MVLPTADPVRKGIPVPVMFVTTGTSSYCGPKGHPRSPATQVLPLLYAPVMLVDRFWLITLISTHGLPPVAVSDIVQ